jgi:hypothetical protein
MTIENKEMLIGKCAQLLYRIFIDIRALSYEEGNAEKINDLADLAHNIPLFMVGRDDSVGTWLRSACVRHAKKTWPHLEPEQTVYVRILDMDEEEFYEMHGKHNFNELLTALTN